eukprot:Gb_31159 [translate_table: standard]
MPIVSMGVRVIFCIMLVAYASAYVRPPARNALSLLHHSEDSDVDPQQVDHMAIGLGFFSPCTFGNVCPWLENPSLLKFQNRDVRSEMQCHDPFMDSVSLQSTLDFELLCSSMDMLAST